MFASLGIFPGLLMLFVLVVFFMFSVFRHLSVLAVTLARERRSTHRHGS